MTSWYSQFWYEIGSQAFSVLWMRVTIFFVIYSKRFLSNVHPGTLLNVFSLHLPPPLILLDCQTIINTFTIQMDFPEQVVFCQISLFVVWIVQIWTCRVYLKDSLKKRHHTWTICILYRTLKKNRKHNTNQEKWLYTTQMVSRTWKKIFKQDTIPRSNI